MIGQILLVGLIWGFVDRYDIHFVRAVCFYTGSQTSLKRPEGGMGICNQ